MDAKPNLTTKTLLSFLAITFGLTWGLGALFTFFPDQITAITGEISMQNPLFMLAVYSPAIAGLILVSRHYGIKGLGRFLQRLTLWRTSPWWWLAVILLIPAVMYAGAALKDNLSTLFPFSPWYQVFPALALALFLGPIEELGWRGFALPLLQQKFAPLWAGLILGVIWMVWHIPAFLIGGTLQSGWAFAPYFVGGVASSIIITALFNDSRGSLLLPALLHFQMNNPIWPDAQPWDNLLLAVAAIVIIWINRRKMFRRGAGVTDILLPESKLA
jgi:membrane protease YdiL (CAAX protease family)